MIYSTATVPVNPEGKAKLTLDQVWAGLELKTRDAHEFLPAGLCTRRDVTEESATHFVHDATIGGKDLREIIVLEPRRKVTLFQVTGLREGAIINEIVKDDTGALHLRFYCYLGPRDAVPNGTEEQAEQALFDSEQGNKAALLSTLERTRVLVADGRHPPARTKVQGLRVAIDLYIGCEKRFRESQTNAHGAAGDEDYLPHMIASNPCTSNK